MCNVYSPLDDEFTELLTDSLKKAYVVKVVKDDADVYSTDFRSLEKVFA